MLTILIIVAAIDLALTFAVFCGQRALWARITGGSDLTNNLIVGDIASADALRAAVASRERPSGHIPPRPMPSQPPEP